MAHPLEMIARREAELDALSRLRGLSPDEVVELDRLLERRRIVMHRLPRQIMATKRKLDRLQRVYFATTGGEPPVTLTL